MFAHCSALEIERQKVIGMKILSAIAIVATSACVAVVQLKGIRYVRDNFASLLYRRPPPVYGTPFSPTNTASLVGGWRGHRWTLNLSADGSANAWDDPTCGNAPVTALFGKWVLNQDRIQLLPTEEFACLGNLRVLQATNAVMLLPMDSLTRQMYRREGVAPWICLSKESPVTYTLPVRRMTFH